MGIAQQHFVRISQWLSDSGAAVFADSTMFSTGDGKRIDSVLRTCTLVEGVIHILAGRVCVIAIAARELGEHDEVKSGKYSVRRMCLPIARRDGP